MTSETQENSPTQQDKTQSRGSEPETFEDFLIKKPLRLRVPVCLLFAFLSAAVALGASATMSSLAATGSS